MKYCSKCLEPLCRCGRRKIEIDYYIYPAVHEFNRKGYKTTACCSGHEDDGKLGTYIEFEENLDVDFSSEYVGFHSYIYNGIHIKRNMIRPISDISIRFKKKRTDKQGLIRDVNHDLYLIAKNIPLRNLDSSINDKDFPPEYFYDSSYSMETPELQKPWITIIPSSHDCRELIDQFFECTNDKEYLYEVILDPRRAAAPYRLNSFDFAEKEQNRMKKHIYFDSISRPSVIQFGYERDTQIETGRIGGSIWYLSYALITPQNYNYSADYNASYDIMTDVIDYSQDCDDEDIINAFKYGFDKLISNGVNICAYSSGNTIIVFSNGLDFSYDGSSGGNAVVFGKIDCDDSSFKFASVRHKECLFIVNGVIISRKEIN